MHRPQGTYQLTKALKRAIIYPDSLPFNNNKENEMSIIKYFDDEDEGDEGREMKCGYCQKEVRPDEPHIAIPNPEDPDGTLVFHSGANKACYTRYCYAARHPQLQVSSPLAQK